MITIIEYLRRTGGGAPKGRKTLYNGKITGTTLGSDYFATRRSYRLRFHMHAACNMYFWSIYPIWQLSTWNSLEFTSDSAHTTRKYRISFCNGNDITSVFCLHAWKHENGLGKWSLLHLETPVIERSRQANTSGYPVLHPTPSSRQERAVMSFPVTQGFSTPMYHIWPPSSPQIL